MRRMPFSIPASLTTQAAQKRSLVSSVQSPSFYIRRENANDRDSIRQVLTAAFAQKSHLQHREHEIVEELRSAGELSFGLVAALADPKHTSEATSEGLIGYLAVSPVSLHLDSPAEGAGGIPTDLKLQKTGWYALGPVAVSPQFQGQRIGTALIWKAREELCQQRAKGWVVCGKREYYERFGFARTKGVWVAGVPRGRIFGERLDGSEWEEQNGGGEVEVRYREAWRG